MQSGSKEGEEGRRDEERGRGKRGPSLPAAPAKSLPIATKNFFKGMRSVAQEAANMTSRANLPWDFREGSSSCASFAAKTPAKFPHYSFTIVRLKRRRMPCPWSFTQKRQ